MFHYLIVLLDDTSTSFCHCDNPYKEHNLMPLDTLREAFQFAWRQNLNIQIVYPDYILPNEYYEIINEVGHTDIVPLEIANTVEIAIVNSTKTAVPVDVPNIVVRDTFKNIVASYDSIKSMLGCGRNISLVITDVPSVSREELVEYQKLLSKLGKYIANSILNGKILQLSNITDRLTLSKMKNCDAGWRSITLAPNGKFYICPSFFYSNKEDNVGSIGDGIRIVNQHLFDIAYAPLCSSCDSFQCRRCAWLNKLMTREFNTPSYQQCILAHYERNAAEMLLNDIRKSGEYLNGVSIPHIDYLDPLENLIKHHI